MDREQIFESIRRDIASFADPATEVLVSDRGAYWTQMRKVIEVGFVRGEGELPDIKLNDRIFRYREFFASEHMADLKALAEGTYQELGKVAIYVDVLAKQEGDLAPRPALPLLRSLASEDLSFGATRLVFVRGGAGAGKTFTLRHLAAEQAARFLEGKTHFLFFYIDAQGRALARLDEAIALLLQDLRARFTYHAVATLTRLGILTPIIDGFDELLGTGGYGEAFQSLARFLARLDGRGSVIASARSTFYEYKNFGQSASKYEELGSLSFEIVPADFLPWGKEQVGSYLAQTGAYKQLEADTPEAGVERLYNLVGDAGVEFLQTPFFVATILSIIGQGGSLSVSKRLVPQLVEHFVIREMDKMRNRDQLPILDMQGHVFLLQSLAEEMWWQETRELDTDTVKTLAEIACEHLGIGYPNAITVIERIPAYAFLENREREGRRHLAFQHEYYYSYFLGRLIAQIVGKQGDLAQFLSRSTLPNTVGEEFGFSLPESAEGIARVIEYLGGRKVTPIAREISRSNTGVLYAGIIRAQGKRAAGVTFRQADLVNSSLRNTTLRDCAFEECGLLHVDLVGADWQRIGFARCNISSPKVALNMTHFPGVTFAADSDILGIVLVKEDGQEESYFDPNTCASILKQLGAVPRPQEEVAPVPVISERARKHIGTLNKFIRIANRRFYVSDDDLMKTGIHATREWPKVLELLQEYGLLKTVRIQRRGPEGEVLRLAVPPSELERGEAEASQMPEVREFWKEIKMM